MSEKTVEGFGTIINDLEDEGHWLAVLASMRPYQAKPRQYSVTTLIAPTQPVHLKRTRWQDVAVNASNLLFRLDGISHHALFEPLVRPHVKTEVALKIERVIDEKPAWISGRLDEVEEVEPGKVVIRDRKKMKVYGAIKGITPENEGQLNLYAHVYDEMYGTETVGLQIVGFLSDFTKTKTNKRWAAMKRNGKRAIKLFDSADEAGSWIEAQNDKHLLFIETREPNYPESQEFVADVPLWPKDKTEAFMLERLRLHLAPEPLPCSPDERWNGNRCKHYCDVAGICPQYNKEHTT